MSKDDTVSELEKLRAELAVLKEEQRQTTAPPPEKAAPAPEISTEASLEQGASSTSAQATDAEAGEEEVKSQLDELAALLEHEIRDLPTITCLTVFSLGILMGRLLR
jgi:hypothetical protein